MSQVLILGGTAEARLLATRLSGQAGVKPLVSLSGATTAPLPQGVPTRTGGFGGPAGLAAWLAD
ncbi:MAG: precorrin-6A/cobalt-precorrin-6A reductase, partial [Pseudomonadota bacterium]